MAKRCATFEDWMKKVDQILSDLLMGLDSNDLPDRNYADWYEEGMPPASLRKMQHG